MSSTRIDRGSTESTTIYSDGADLVFERMFDAPRQQVWNAFTDEELIQRWWGPKGTTTTVAAMDVRPGGSWQNINCKPGRDDVSFYGVYLEVEPPDRFKWTFHFDVEGLGAQGGPETFTFDDIGGRTKVTSRGHFGSPEAIDGALASGMIGGAIESWDRLEALLVVG